MPNPGGFPNGAAGDPQRRQVESFMLAFDSNMAPIVGQQATLVSSGAPSPGLALLARKMIIKDNSADDESKRSIIVQTKDPAVVIPAAGGADDPRCGSDPSGTVKASIVVESAASGQSHTSDLVCDNWSTLGPSSCADGIQVPRCRARQRHGEDADLEERQAAQGGLQGEGRHQSRLRSAARGAAGTVAVRIQSGAALTCLQCGPFGDNDGSNGRKFLGKGSSCTLPASCSGGVGGSGGPVDDRIDLFIQRAQVTSPVPECDLVVKGTLGGLARGWYYRPALNNFQGDRAAEAPLTDAQLRLISQTPGQMLTYTCVPPGSGQRIGVDRDDDGFFDRDEIDAGSDPADPLSTP